MFEGNEEPLSSILWARARGILLVPGSPAFVQGMVDPEGKSDAAAQPAHSLAGQAQGFFLPAAFR